MTRASPSGRCCRCPSNAPSLLDVDQDVVAFDLDRIVLQVLFRRRRDALPGADLEGGLVQRALDALVLDEARRQQRIGMRAHVVETKEAVVQLVARKLLVTEWDRNWGSRVSVLT